MSPKIDSDSLESVKEYLQNELSYCNCASSLTLDLLYLTLTFARDIPNSPSKIQKSEILPLGFGEWFIFFLESKGLIWHGFNNSDFAVNPLGRQLLQGLENFRTELNISQAILNDLADIYLQMELYDIALRTIRAFVKEFPDEAIGYHTQAEILVALNQFEKAEASISKSIELEASEEKHELRAYIEKKNT